MLDEVKINALKNHMICEETLKEIEDYDPVSRIVTFKDGSQHQIVECWTRVMGYFRPVNDFNNGKKSEFNERKWFVEAKIEGGCPCNEEN